MYITINDVIGQKKLTYLIQFALVGKLQLLACLMTMFITSIETSFSHGSYFKHKKDDSK